jgi:hypothetical protein
MIRIRLFAAILFALVAASAQAQTYNTFATSQGYEYIYDPGAALTNTPISVTINTSRVDWQHITLSNPAGAARTVVVACLDVNGNSVYQQASVAAASATNVEIIMDPDATVTTGTAGAVLIVDHPCDSTKISVAQAASAPTLKAYGRSSRK